MRSDTAVEPFYDDLAARVRTLPGVRNAATARTEKPDGPVVFAEQGDERRALDQSQRLSRREPELSRHAGHSDCRRTRFPARRPRHGDGRRDRRRQCRSPPVAGSSVSCWTHDQARGGDSKRPWLRVVGVARSVELLPAARLSTCRPSRRFTSCTATTASAPRPGRTRRRRGGARNRPPRLSAFDARSKARRRGCAARSCDAGWKATTARDNRPGFLPRYSRAFGGFGLLLCGVGLYGVLAYTVSRRLRELATRIALGAQSRDVVRVVLHDAAVTVLAGIGIGAFLALAATGPSPTQCSTLATSWCSRWSPPKRCSRRRGAGVSRAHSPGDPRQSRRDPSRLLRGARRPARSSSTSTHSPQQTPSSPSPAPP